MAKFIDSANLVDELENKKGRQRRFEGERNVQPDVAKRIREHGAQSNHKGDENTAVEP